MRILGLDLGSKTLGIALSTSDHKMAIAKETYRFPEDEYDFAIDKVIEYQKQYKIDKIVLGLPKHMNGEEGIRAEISKTFKSVLEQELSIEVILVDERLTTAISLNSLKNINSGATKRKKLVDQYAAQVILQDYLDRINNEE